MAIFRRGKRIHGNVIKSVFTKAVFHANDFPHIEMLVTIEGGMEGEGRKMKNKKKLEETEILLTMTLFEANKMLKNFQLTTTNAMQMTLPHNAINIPWGEG